MPFGFMFVRLIVKVGLIGHLLGLVEGVYQLGGSYSIDGVDASHAPAHAHASGVRGLPFDIQVLMLLAVDGRWVIMLIRFCLPSSR